MNLSRRLSNHLAPSSLARKTHRANWIKSVLARGETIKLVELECVPPDGDWAERERYWIAYYRSIGHRLTNHTDGGEGVPGIEMSAETREKIGRAHRGRVHSAEVRRRNSESKKGKRHTPEARAKVRDYQKWFGNLPEERERRRQRGFGRRHTDESRRRMSEAKTGYRFSEEAKAKMSESAKRRAERERLERLENGGQASIRTNYERGKEAERKIRDRLEESGYYCVESRGSHGAIDVVGIGNNRLVLVQSKRTKRSTVTPAMYAEDIEKLRSLAKNYELPPNTSLELWAWIDRRGFRRWVIEGDDLREVEAL